MVFYLTGELPYAEIERVADMQTLDRVAIIEIFLNGRLLPTQAGSLEELVARHTVAGAKVATALNGQFVAEAQRGNTPLQAGDKVEIVTPRQGG